MRRRWPGMGQCKGAARTSRLARKRGGCAPPCLWRLPQKQLQACRWGPSGCHESANSRGSVFRAKRVESHADHVVLLNRLGGEAEKLGPFQTAPAQTFPLARAVARRNERATPSMSGPVSPAKLRAVHEAHAQHQHDPPVAKIRRRGPPKGVRQGRRKPVAFKFRSCRPVALLLDDLFTAQAVTSENARRSIPHVCRTKLAGSARTVGSSVR